MDPNQSHRDVQIVPRACLDYLHGAHLQVLPSSLLPDIQCVRREIKRLHDMGPDSIRHPLEWNTALPNLLKWSYYVHVPDVPPDMVEDVISTLKILVPVFQKCSTREIKAMGFLPSDQPVEVAHYLLLYNSRQKLCQYLLLPEIDRPSEALPYLEWLVENDTYFHRGSGNVPWLENPSLYSMYANALVLSGVFTAKTKVALEHVLEAADQSRFTRIMDFTPNILSARLGLSLVLTELGDPEAQKHTEWGVKFLRRNASLLPERDLRYTLIRANQPPHPVLVALGGEKWFVEDMRNPRKAENWMQKTCKHCGVHDLQKTLFHCAGCTTSYYCSKECQRADWKSHKMTCRDLQKTKARIEQMRKTDPRTAERLTDWLKWRNLVPTYVLHALIHAFNLKRDITRGRRHIFVQLVEHMPRVKDLRYRFRVVQCGLFTIKDMTSSLDGLFAQLAKKAGAEPLTMQGLVKDVDAMLERIPGGDAVPMITLKYGIGCGTSLNRLTTSQDLIRDLPYDPNWRRLINQDENDPPQPLIFSSRKRDAEFVF
ncbi:hypothetical protein SCP_1701600 [Sparassis crispa]|uniref:MYND-type domain-containing protein n=1 Tax=Sparassis crispa TaxID=139825 RepID=A0A401H5X1_9APHY|nr:hypothetical protein SCP_1701600 [Sparassis crispa]GBE89835.1 hypothetical protein SCP_1701600 [Sparassis crispa]